MADPAEEPRAVASTRTADIVVSVLLAAFAALMAWDNWKSGAGWASDGPKSGYFPFYLSLLLGAASLFGMVKAFVDRAGAGKPFVNRDQLRRVMQVLCRHFSSVFSHSGSASTSRASFSSPASCAGSAGSRGGNRC